ncbi:hypothetical protein [Wohlfahrtiimonas chitiniclastica]|uniref:hypothetical protein n=1 Tax=Wohlfahrtiimonas chitiniclastica TaxID=400946 RepID=UPI0007B69A49|nr:hypothetical protein [Wohlfahrtiimonas chitiniclastica]KZX38182.1 hypothetical protein A6V30_04700 [Wohlfahrtiimonas chitiniclastica]MBS7821070.1 hypothetical protein [Wohlfahrtiimonas chitiniclastica]OYQ76155.1 hypothetical protein B9T18_02000 [Wohlfahrtiimonas chitiniclastica]
MAAALIKDTLTLVNKVKEVDTFRGRSADYMEKTLGFRKLGIAFAIAAGNDYYRQLKEGKEQK